MAQRSKKMPGAGVKKGVDDVGWLKTTGWASIGSALITRINEMQALCQSVTMACVDVYSQDISKVDFKIGRGNHRDFIPFAVDEHPWAGRLALDPNKFHQWREVMALTVAHLVFRQDAYLLKELRNKADTTPDLIPITTKHVQINTAGRNFVYDFTAEDEGQRALLGWSNNKLTNTDVIHIRFRQWGGYSGLSTLKIGVNVFGLNEMLAEFQAALTKSGTRPGSTITVPGELTDDAFSRLKVELKEAYESAARSGTPLILEQGASLSKLSFNAAEMDLVRAKTQLHQEIARLFRMPPYKIGMLESIKAENLAAMEDAYVDDSLIPVCRAIESAFDSALLTDDERRSGIRFMFDRHHLYNRDPGAQMQRVIEAYKAGLLPRNEALIPLGFKRVPAHLNTYSVPVNTALQSLDGEVSYVTPNQAQPGSDAAPADDPAPKE